jgi:GntR family transcriptional regulator
MHPARDQIAQRRRLPARWLRDLLRAEILRGSFGDDVLPSEADLMLAHRASRGVVREALDLLRQEGIVERLQGTGTLVVGQRNPRRLVEVHGVTDVDPVPFASHVLAQLEVRMPATVAHYLEEPLGSPCLLIEYVGMAHGSVVGVYTNYLRYPEAERVAGTPFNGHWYSLLHDAGLEIYETDLLIEAITADESLATHLQVPAGQAVLALQQVIRDASGRPYNFAILRHRGDRLALFSQAASRLRAAQLPPTATIGGQQ